MDATCEPATESKTCPHCNGRGEFACWAQWSDGMGGSSTACSVCNGTGSIDFDPIKQLAELKSQLKDLLYKTWLIAGCRTKSFTSTDARVWAVPSQGLCNDVLRSIKTLPTDLHPARPDQMKEIL